MAKKEKLEEVSVEVGETIREVRIEVPVEVIKEVLVPILTDEERANLRLLDAHLAASHFTSNSVSLRELISSCRTALSKLL